MKQENKQHFGEKNHFFGKKHNTATREKMRAAWVLRKARGPIFTEEVRRKMSEIRQGDKCHLWKGDDVGYHGVHKWIKKEKGAPQFCEHCKCEGGGKRKYHWANKTGAYKREVSDWLRLCLSCHRKHDMIEKSVNRIIGRGSKIRLKPHHEIEVPEQHV